MENHYFHEKTITEKLFFTSKLWHWVNYFYYYNKSDDLEMII